MGIPKLQRLRKESILSDLYISHTASQIRKAGRDPSSSNAEKVEAMINGVFGNRRGRRTIAKRHPVGKKRRVK